MSAPDRITLVLRPAEGSSLEKIAPFAESGMSVAVGRSLAVVDAKIEGSLALHAQAMLELLRRINVKVGGYDAILHHGGEASEAMWQERCKALDDIWALMEQISYGTPALGPQPVDQAPSLNLDEHARMALDAARYRFLRDRDQIEDPDDDLLVSRGATYFTGADLDAEVDTGLRLQRLEQQEDEPCEQ